jgi:small-conductance mechanosensitive channel
MEPITDFLKLIRLEHLPFAILVLGLSYLLFRVLEGYCRRLEERFPNRRLAFKQLTAGLRYGLFLLALGIAGSRLLAVTDDNRLVAYGLLLLAALFALKDLLVSFAAGLALLVDRPFRVGDRVAFGEHYGEVTRIGLISVRLNTLDDNLVTIPNSRFLNETVASANAGALHQMCIFDFYIGCTEDFEEAKRIVHEATASSQYVYLGLPIKVVVREGPVPGGAERFATRLTVKAYVFDGRYETDFGTDVTERVKRAFRERGIRSAGELEWSLGQPGVR